MSKIVYKPHCGQCGSLIEQNIQFKRTIIKADNCPHYLYSTSDYVFEPYQCKVCGAVFDSAEIRLPKEVEYF